MAQANKADQLTVNFAYGGFFTLPLGLTFAAGAGNPADSLVVLGANVANTFNLNGKMLAVDGLPINFAGVQNIKLVGGTASDYYTLVSSPANLTLVNSGGTDTLDFSSDTAAITLNLGQRRPAQPIAPWGKTLALQGVFDNLIGTPYNDALTGGAGTGIINGDGGNNVLRRLGKRRLGQRQRQQHALRRLRQLRLDRRQRHVHALRRLRHQHARRRLDHLRRQRPGLVVDPCQRPAKRRFQPPPESPLRPLPPAPIRW